MKAKHLIWPAGLVVIGLGLVTACREQTPVPVPTPTAAPTVVGLITPGPGTATPTCRVTPPVDWGEYVVQPGDTLLDLAAGRGVTVEQVRQVNCLASNVLVAGTSIYLPLLPTPTPTLTPIPPSPPTPRPTPTFPLVTPTPGIVSLSAMPPVQALGQQQPGGGNQPGAGNAQTGPTVGQIGPANDQPAAAQPLETSPQPSISNLLPVIGRTYRSTLYAGNLNCVDSVILHRPGPYYYQPYSPGPDLPVLSMATDVNWVSLQLCEWSLTEPITLTFSSPDPQIVLSGTLRVKGQYIIWESDPPRPENDTFGRAYIVASIDDTGDSKGAMYNPIDFMLPPGLPPGRWSLAVSYLAGTKLEKIFFYNPPIRLWVDPNRLGFTYKGCIVLSYDEVVKEPLRIAGNNFPLDLEGSIPLGIYSPISHTDVISNPGSIPGIYVISYTRVASTTAEIKEGALSTTISIDPAKIITGTEYLVTAAINPAGLPIEAEREIFDCFYVPDGTELTDQSPPEPAEQNQVPDGTMPTDQLPPVPEGPGRVPDGRFPADQPPIELPTFPPDESLGFVPTPSSFADPPAALSAAPTGAPQAADDSTRPAVAGPPVGGAGYNLLPILGLLEVAGLGGWLWLRRRRG